MIFSLALLQFLLSPKASRGLLWQGSLRDIIKNGSEGDYQSFRIHLPVYAKYTAYSTTMYSNLAVFNSLLINQNQSNRNYYTQKRLKSSKTDNNTCITIPINQMQNLNQLHFEPSHFPALQASRPITRQSRGYINAIGDLFQYSIENFLQDNRLYEESLDKNHKDTIKVFKDYK